MTSETDDRWRRALLPADATLGQTIENLTEVGIKLALCVGADNRLLGSVSDGDLRRGLLRGLTMADSVREVINVTPWSFPKAQHATPCAR